MILFLLDPSITEKNKKVGHTLRLSTSIQHDCPNTQPHPGKIKVHEWEVSIKQLSERLELFICLWGSFFLPILPFPQ